MVDNNKKLLYITRYFVDEEFHLKKKFDGQIAAFNKLGFDVYLIGIDKKYFYLIHNKEKIIYGKAHFNIPTYIHTQFYNDLHKVAAKVIRRIGFDYVYWRFSSIWRSNCKVAEAIRKTSGKLLLEIPTFPIREKPLSFSRKVFSIYSNLFSKRFNALIDYYVVIGEDAKGEYKGKPAINIENGIDVSLLPCRTPIIDKERIHILALASMSYWHGYDRLIKSLAEYKGNQSVVIHMVGGNEGGSLSDWKELAGDLRLEDKVIFHGGLYGDDLDKMIDKCDLGCASLRRKNHSHVSELKTRDYTARGLPFILSLADETFSSATKKFWYLIPNDDTIPDMDDIIEFARKMRDDKSIIPYMRSFAEDNLTWEIQYKKLFEKIERIEAASEIKQ